MEGINSQSLTNYIHQMEAKMAGSSTDPDHATQFEEFGDAAYEALYVLYNSNTPSYLNAGMIVKTAIDFYNYLEAQAGNLGTVGKKLLSDFNTSMGTGEGTLIEVLQNGASGLSPTSWVQENSSNPFLKQLFNDLYQVDNSYLDMKKPNIDRIEGDITLLQQYLENYRTAYEYHDQISMNAAMGNIARMIDTLNGDASNDHLQDGFLTTLINAIDLPIANNAGSLLGISLNLYKQPANPALLAQMETALNAMGENGVINGPNGSMYGTLTTLIDKTLSEEPWPPIPPSK